MFVCQEDYQPHALSVIGLSEETLITGGKKVEYALETFGKCLKSGVWPGYSNRIEPLPFDIYDAERWAAKEIR